jgi:type II secretory pathway pseudopilin PulG
MTRFHKGLDTKAFTIIELMIATLVFSIILIVVTAGVIQFTNEYYKGITASNTQSTARAISDAITQDIQFSAGDVGSVTETDTSRNPDAFCAGGHLYSLLLGKQVSNPPSSVTTLDQSYHGLLEDTNPISGACGSPMPETMNVQALPTASTRELLGDHMRIANLVIARVGGTQLYNVKVRVVYGDNDLLNNPASTTPTCKTTTGSQFCAVSELDTTVEKRL